MARFGQRLFAGREHHFSPLFNPRKIKKRQRIQTGCWENAGAADASLQGVLAALYDGISNGSVTRSMMAMGGDIEPPDDRTTCVGNPLMICQVNERIGVPVNGTGRCHLVGISQMKFARI